MPADENRIRILVIESNPVLLQGIVSLLRDEPDIEHVGSAMSALDAADQLREVRPNVILINLGLAGTAPAMTVRHLRRVDPDVSIIILVSYELDPVSTSLMQAGAAAIIANHQLESSLVHLIRTTRAGQTNT